MSDVEIHSSCSKFDIDILEQASYILWSVWKSLHPQYSSLQACISALSEDTNLYQTLKRAHGQRKYDVVRQWVATPLRTARPEALLCTDSAARQTVDKFLDNLRPSMMSLVSGQITLPYWTPDRNAIDEPVALHLESLRIPCLHGKPNVLLHDLGGFRREKTLAARLNNIFMANHHTFLVNTSGSGKTRLLLEGLCGHWGFYFTSLVDSSLLGSTDVQNSIRSYVPDSPNFRHALPPTDSPQHQPALKTNRDSATRVFSRVFLARLFVFDLFIQMMRDVWSRERDKFREALYKQRWLLLQLQPSILCVQDWDIFDDLLGKLGSASEIYVNRTTKALLIQIRKTLAEISLVQDAGNAAQIPFFCVLDEAQYAATQHCGAFRSNNGHAQRPILREIVRAWEGQASGHGVFMVVAGTGISKDVVDQAMASAIMKESKYRWCSGTGAFD